MPLTYIKIASATVGSGGAANIDFTSIPNTYTDICIKLSLRSTTTGDWCALAINGSSASFSTRAIRGNGSSVDTFTETANNFSIYMNASGTTANTFSNTEIYIPEYAGSRAKSLIIDTVQEGNTTTAYSLIQGILWNETSAINQFTITPRAGATFAQYSTATLYGIKKD
jgi:hypothetical protein